MSLIWHLVNWGQTSYGWSESYVAQVFKGSQPSVQKICDEFFETRSYSRWLGDVQELQLIILLY